MMTEREFKKAVEAAYQRNVGRDQIEREAGHTAESDMPVMVQLRTAMAALKAGMIQSDWDFIAEAYAFMEHITNRFTSQVLVISSGPYRKGKGKQ